MPAKPYRLPPDARPSRYDIHLRVKVGEPTFRGSVRIALRLFKPTRRIELHQSELDIQSVEMEAGGRRIDGVAETDSDRELAALRFPTDVPAGDATLTIEFEGKVNASMEGLYLSKDGDEQMLVTQFEETEARACFPCFDEPEFKASFAWTITTTPDVTVLTNGTLASTKDEPDGWRTWTFAPTRTMSSYLAALCIGKLASTAELKARGVPLRVWALSGKERLGGFGNALAAKLLPWFEDYFGQPYPFVKYDQVAVPSFSAGAMENAGLVTFRQAYLLRDKTTSFKGEAQIARVVAHEFAHMWFGNLVTMAWWDDIWLNESFAEWMANKAVDTHHPEYRVWLAQQQERMYAMVPDALASTHAIYAPVATADEAKELFDAITYYKGAAVMRMLEAFLGEEPFRTGLRTYMEEFKERNAEGKDLWRHLAQASGQPVARIMESWILQGGYPIVRVSLEGARLKLAQERFLSAPDAAPAKQSWVVPIVVKYADAGGVHVARHILDGATGDVALPARGAVKWAHANADAGGFYRQHLDDDLLEAILAHARELSPAEQMGLVDDQWALFRKGTIGAPAFLHALEAVLGVADDPRVLETLHARLLGVEELLADAQDDAGLGKPRAWTRRLVAPKLVTPAAGARDAAFRRGVLLSIAAGVGHDPRAVDEARAVAAQEAREPGEADPDLADPAVALAAQFGDAARLDVHLQEYEKRRATHAPPAQVERYLNALAEFRDPALVRQVLEYATSGKMPLESVGPLFRAMMRRRHARVETWAHVRSEWAFVRERLGDYWTQGLVERGGDLPVEMKAGFVRFCDANLGGVAQQSYARAVETLDQRAAWEPRARRELSAWFAGR